MAWSRIRGHDHLVARFRRVYEQGRLGHAYLLAGPPGVGKRLFAREFAKALLCEQPPAPLTACDRCPGCRLVEADNHPDYLCALKPEDKQEFPIETMRAFIETLGLKPSRGSRKVALVEDADDFNEESANVFLKTLEEPPPGSLLMLRVTSLETQLPTILSRCQPVRFAPLPTTLVQEVLAAQGVADAARLAAVSGGSVGRAIALADPAVAGFRVGLAASLAAPQFDAAAFSENAIRFVETAGKESARQRDRAAVGLQMLIDLLRNALRLAVDPTVAEEPLKAFAHRLGPEKILTILEAALSADRHVEQRVTLNLTLELLADRMMLGV